MARVGIFPASFNPPTIAHLAVAKAAYEQHNLDQVILAHSRAVLGKDRVEVPRFEDRARILDELAAEHHWLDTLETEHQLMVDIAQGYDVLIMGADKWHQIQEVAWYGSEAARNQALADLPQLAVAPRTGFDIPAECALQLEQTITTGVSSTKARQGNVDLMVEPARRFAEKTGAWLDDGRYLAWLGSQG